MSETGLDFSTLLPSQEIKCAPGAVLVHASPTEQRPQFSHKQEGYVMSPSPAQRILLSHWRPTRTALYLLTAIASFLVALPAGAQAAPPVAPNIGAVGKSVAQQVVLLLDQARAARSAGHLVTPPGTNAAALYAEVLQLDPGNVEARAAIIDMRQTIHASLANVHGQSIELRQLDRLAASLAVTQGNGGATAPHHARPSPPPPVEHHSPADNVQAPAPPPDHSKAPPNPQNATPSAAANDIDQLIQSLPIGHIVFNTPNAMRVSQPQTIELVLSGSETVDELRKQITASGALSSDQIKISDELDVHLTGAAFQIQTVTPESQAVGITHTSHWEWQVTPTQRGQQQLHLTVNAILRVDGVDREVSIQTYDRTIPVNVDWSNSLSAFFAANWQWLWTAIFVPIALVVWPWLRKKRAAKGAQSPD